MVDKKIIFDNIKKLFSKNDVILSLYAYGSILTNRYNSEKSDIDLLFIIRDIDNPGIFLEEIRKIQENNPLPRMDINIVFYSEFLKRWHIYRPPTYFIGIKLQNKLLLGEDLLNFMNLNEVTPEIIYHRAVDLAQSSRGVYINSKDAHFWKNKYIRWLKVLALEVLYLQGSFELSFNEGLKKLIEKDQNFNYLENLKNENIPISEINNIAEKLRVYLYNSYMKNGK